METPKNNGFIKFNRNYDPTIHQFPLAFNLLAGYIKRIKNIISVKGGDF